MRKADEAEAARKRTEEELERVRKETAAAARSDDKAEAARKRTEEELERVRKETEAAQRVCMSLHLYIIPSCIRTCMHAYMHDRNAAHAHTHTPSLKHIHARSFCMHPCTAHARTHAHTHMHTYRTGKSK